MGRHFLGALATAALFGAEAVEVRIGAHVARDADLVSEDLVGAAFADSLQLVSDALHAGSHLQEMMDAAEYGIHAGSHLQEMAGAPEAAVALNSKVEDDAEGAPGGQLDALMKAGQMIAKGIKGDQAPAAGAGGADLLKALGQMFGGKGSASALLTKKAKSSSAAGPAASQAAKAFAGSGAEDILKKLGKVMGLAQPAAVKRLQAAVDREPDQLLVTKLTNLKHFLDALLPNDPRVRSLRASLETPEGVRKLAKFAESVRDVEQGYEKHGEMWGTTDEGFDATARLVAASEAMDGQQHEPFSAETAMALKKYMEDHPEEARMSIKAIHDSFPNGRVALKK